jgi:ADP-ribosylglycohydrolase
MIDRRRGALIGLAVGDALGAAVGSFKFVNETDRNSLNCFHRLLAQS